MGRSPRPTATKLLYGSLRTSRPDPPGKVTPPLRPPAAVPFLWEEAPGKPRAGLVPTQDEERQVGGGKARLNPPPTAAYGTMGCPTAVAFGGPSVMMGASSSRGEEELGNNRRRRGRERLVRSWRRGGGRSGVECMTWGGGIRSPPTKAKKGASGSGEEAANVTTWRRQGTHGIRVRGISSAAAHLWETLFSGLKHAVMPWRKKKECRRLDGGGLVHVDRNTLRTLLA